MRPLLAALCLLLASSSFADDVVVKRWRGKSKIKNAFNCDPDQWTAIHKSLDAGKERIVETRRRLAAKDATAVAAARALFYPDYQDKMAMDVWLKDIDRVLGDANLPKRCGAAGGRCKDVLARVPRDDEDQIVFCPDFFKLPTDEARTRVTVHEAAHVAGAIPEVREVYCPGYFCDSPCADQSIGSPEYNAENWSQFAHCAVGGKSETILDIKAGPQRPKKKKKTAH